MDEESDVGLKLANNLKHGLQRASAAGKAKFVHPHLELRKQM